MSNLMMIVTTLEELRSAQAILDKPVGFVPTMGYLHEGHLSLARQARKECAGVIASIFVNPTQFGPNEDLSKYPCDLERDLRLLEEAGVDLVWTPTPEIMYPAGFQTWVTVEELTQPLEGAIRPGHFRGVTTIVTKLFNSVQPQKAYFGQKDAQQAAVIKRMTMDLNFPIEIVVCPTIREPDGLAMSSRNIYLNPDERQAATVLYRALNAAKASYEQGEQDAGSLKLIMTGIIISEPLAKLQYVSCTDLNTLKELEEVTGKALISMAVYFGKTRLIDNFVLG
ncbi:MAG: pantoate--beta-alanine ligase [Anaerolineales bacterium]|nr:pantoate--beta-alanine ligase [Anaerolineales bacterium]